MLPPLGLKEQVEGVSGNWREKAVVIGENRGTGVTALSTATKLFPDKKESGE